MAYILVVDDDEDFALATARVLEAKGYEVKLELGTSNVIDSVRRRCPDLIILDVMFPEDSTAGFSLARRIRKIGDGGASVPILLLTGINATFPLGFNLDDTGDDWIPANDFLEKPVDLDVLNARVEALLANALPENV